MLAAVVEEDSVVLRMRRIEGVVAGRLQSGSGSGGRRQNWTKLVFVRCSVAANPTVLLLLLMMIMQLSMMMMMMMVLMMTVRMMARSFLTLLLLLMMVAKVGCTARSAGAARAVFFVVFVLVAAGSLESVEISDLFSRGRRIAALPVAEVALRQGPSGIGGERLRRRRTGTKIRKTD